MNRDAEFQVPELGGRGGLCILLERARGRKYPSTIKNIYQTLKAEFELLHFVFEKFLSSCLSDNVAILIEEI